MLKTSTEIASIANIVGELKAVEMVAQALRQAGYAGYLTLEADRYCNDATTENIYEKVQNMAKTTRKIAQMVG